LIATTNFCFDWLYSPPRYVQNLSEVHITKVSGNKYNYEVYLYIVSI